MVCSAMRPSVALISLLASTSLCAMAPAQPAPAAAKSAPPDASEARMIQAVDATNAASIALLDQIVNINSGTMNIPGVLAVRDVLVPRIQALGFQTTWHPMDEVHRAGDLVAVHPCPAGTGHCGKRILAIGHMDPG